MQLSDADIQRIARLARLGVSPAELDATRDKLNAILQLIDEMQAEDTEGVAPLAHPTAFEGAIALRLREDAVTEPVGEAGEAAREALMANAPAQREGMFLVPKVIE